MIILRLSYLIKTWHPSCGAAALRAELIAGFAHTEWLGLTVFEHCWQDGDNIGFATNHVAANETEASKTSQDTRTVSSSSEQNQSSNKTQTSEGVKTNTSAHWDGDYYVKADGSKAKSVL